MHCHAVQSKIDSWMFKQVTLKMALGLTYRFLILQYIDGPSADFAVAVLVRP